MNYIYCILNDQDKTPDGKYTLSNEAFDILIKKADTQEAKDYLYLNRERLLKRGWAFNMIYLMRQACGHYEIFQSFVRSEHEALKWLERMSLEAQTRKCTFCICSVKN